MGSSERDCMRDAVVGSRESHFNPDNLDEARGYWYREGRNHGWDTAYERIISLLKKGKFKRVIKFIESALTYECKVKPLKIHAFDSAGELAEAQLKGFKEAVLEVSGNGKKKKVRRRKSGKQ